MERKILIEEKETTPTGWIFEVRVGNGAGATVHEVIVSKEYWEKLTGLRRDPTELVRKSFEFLLEREPKESILRTFELPVIQRYFPEYENEIRNMPQ